MSSEDDKKVKRKRKSKPKSKSKKSKKNKGPKARVIWLYGAHECIVTQAGRRLLNYGSEDSIRLRQQLDISLDEFVVPVYPYPAGPRPKAVKQLYEVEDATIIVLGIPSDKKVKKIRSLYEGTEAAFFHPQERQFHIDMMRESADITFAEAIDRRDEWLEFLGKHFKDVKVIR